MRNSLKNSGDTVLVIYNILDTYMKQRNGIVDIIRGCAMLLVVLGHTMSGTVREFSDSLLFQAIWTLQMPLFIVISGYVTRYSRPLEDSRGLWKFIKKRTLAYLLPWGVWTIVVRGLIFGQSNMLNIKKLLWNMDNGYWFLVTIWTISMIYGISDLLSNKWFKEKKLNVFAHFFFCGIGLIGLAVVGYLMGLNFFAIKLTLYYLPIYLLGYMYGQIQHWVMARANGKYFVNIVIVASLALWLAAINRFDFFAGADNLMMIFGRFIASSLGCIAVIGLFCKYNGSEFSKFSRIGVHSLEMYLTHYLFLSLVPPLHQPVLASMEGMFTIFMNYLLTLAMTVMIIKMVRGNNILNYLLYAKRESTKS